MVAVDIIFVVERSIIFSNKFLIDVFIFFRADLMANSVALFFVSLEVRNILKVFPVTTPTIFPGAELLPIVAEGLECGNVIGEGELS